MALDMMDMARGYEFWRDGCRAMAMVVCETLRLANEPVTSANIIKFVTSLPRKESEPALESWQKGYCGSCLEKAFAAAPKEDAEMLLDYIVRYFPNRTWVCQETLIDSFIGILSGIAAREEMSEWPTSTLNSTPKGR